MEVSSGKGAVARLNDEQKQHLTAIIDGGAVTYGFEGAVWTIKRVQRVIEEQFGVVYSQSQVGRILKQLNYTPQKPQKVDYRQSKEALETWKTTHLPALKKKPRQRPGK